MNPYITLLLYIIPLTLFVLWRRRRLRDRDRKNQQFLEETRQAGLTEPASLHPKIDRHRCIGCNTCAMACPEGNVLGIIGSRVELINPSHCIGHGACADACPVGAITLVFGSEKRGVDIPMVSPNFETNVPGVFIAGELGGMGLIRNAITQGRQALEAISQYPGVGKNNKINDVVIIGAGPAGIAATLGAVEKGLRYITVEQDSFGGTVAHFPRGKIVMTQPAQLPLVGMVKFRETTKETLLGFWQEIAQKHRLQISYQERLEGVSHQGDHLLVKTSKSTYATRTVLLAIGRRGTPRKLDVPGEDLPKVVYRLIDAEQYRGQHVLVVGGGDSALEAATSIAEQPGTQVTLSYRSGSFSRAKPKNRDKVDQAQKAGRLKVLLNSDVTRIDKQQVELRQQEQNLTLDNDAVIISAGGVLPNGLLKEIGIEIETKYGTA